MWKTEDEKVDALLSVDFVQESRDDRLSPLFFDPLTETDSGVGLDIQGA